MKKIIGVVVLLAFICSESFASSWKTGWRLKKGDTISGEFKVFSKYSIPLPEGEFTVVYKFGEDVGWGIATEGLTLVQMDENNIPIKAFDIARAYGLTKFSGYLEGAINHELFEPKSHGCKKRIQYSYLNFFKKGGSHNCLVIEHWDIQREVYGVGNTDPDFHDDKIFSSQFRRWVKEENVKLADIYLNSSHTYMSLLVRDQWIVVTHAETPESFANYKIKFNTRDTSEFHPSNINKYPKAKKIMEDWKKVSAQRHRDFENVQKIKKHHALDLSEFASISHAPKKKSSDISEQLKKLHDLYKEGVITGYEYERAKKKILE
tara:strand:- start:59 stop:1018 length:960 start_codon:yes stop_codon:yes gene_type:complete